MAFRPDFSPNNAVRNLLSSITDSTTVNLPYNLEHINPEIAGLIHSHWLRFPAVTFPWHVTFGIIVLILGVISISGNAAVIYIFSQTKGLRNPSNALIVNLAMSDFAMMISNCPMYFMNSLSGKWIFGMQACRFYGFCGALFGCASIITMAAIAVDRYLVICKPFLIMKSTMTRERAKFAVAFVWLYSLCWAVPPLFGISNYVLEGFLTTCSFDYLDESYNSRAFIFSMCIGAYVAPLSVIIISYLLIIWEVYTHSKKFAKAASTMKTANNKMNEEMSKKKKEIKTAKIAFVIIVCWVIAWTPYAIVAVLGIATDKSLLTPLASQVPALFAKSAAVYNPIVYAISHPKYREALKKKFPFLICIPDEEGLRRTVTVSSGHGTNQGQSLPFNRQSTMSRGGESALSELDEEVCQQETPGPSAVVAVPTGQQQSALKNSRASTLRITETANIQESPLPALRNVNNPVASISGDPHLRTEKNPAIMRDIVTSYSKLRQKELADEQDSDRMINRTDIELRNLEQTRSRQNDPDVNINAASIRSKIPDIDSESFTNEKVTVI